jgi:hypothetical protein
MNINARRFSVDVTLLSPRYYCVSLMRQPLYHRSDYPPRVVHEVNLVVFRITVIDARRVQDVSVPAGLTLVPADQFVRAGDLVWDGDRGCWNPAGGAHIGTLAGDWIGIARQPN